MTEPKEVYVTETVTNAPADKPKAWLCKCGQRLGWMYAAPRRLMISTDNIHFMVRGDATITHTECGAVNTWCYKRERHGMLEELETGQEIIDTEELGITDLE